MRENETMREREEERDITYTHIMNFCRSFHDIQGDVKRGAEALGKHGGIELIFGNSVPCKH
jgi:hypothetical protein